MRKPLTAGNNHFDQLKYTRATDLECPMQKFWILKLETQYETLPAIEAKGGSKVPRLPEYIFCAIVQATCVYGHLLWG